jgi:hypothetical protein
MRHRFYIITTLCSLAALALIWSAQAAPDSAPAAVSAALAVQENLTKLAGKRVTLTTESGKEYEGTVGEVTKTAVIMQSLGGGKDFFNAWVRLEEVEAITYRAK